VSFPSPLKHLACSQGVVVVGIFIKGDLPMDQYLSDILITIFMHFSLTSTPVYMKVLSS